MFRGILGALVLFGHLALFAEAVNGEALEKEMWEFIKDRKWDEIDKRIAPYFQAAEFDGARDKELYMNHVKGLNIGNYALSDFKVTHGGDLMIVGYHVDVKETIEGKDVMANALRLSVWQKNGGFWQWISHSILVPVPSSQLTQK